MTPDRYPDLPQLPLGVQLEFQDIEPYHFRLPPELFTSAAEVYRAVRALVDQYLGHLGEETIEVVTREIQLSIRHRIAAAKTAGDVTTHD
ncbi:lipase chaperone [Mycobacteroides abscessus]|uniref:lipase chaperone n=1 Tax=Mycobacteroides abscessus TaxID=36809 RepID=UPI0002684380|nr:lipase chaperone [Mycobacteroides abscessus]EIV24595.1 hypothetical protein MA3A0119R_2683 [Mycobacteroides abscessus 3A-0119-R]EIV29642.1 hypothetical protein MA3A0122R_2746 [Mycobacteroides abscessus 3A-0122-R]EIV36428.1 hypothetical protein MA3A0122S_2301 [Mycobacteroides abscessus 3A-0122-S]EIV38749.1 hypothetical protein MA3A0731_2841 [Mycobacteroides abscessus 3A-0731]EIV53414.1 hypothetical protein MA3A0930S_2711 [Mycobacteroides abscessus 3A-0930-S]